MPYRDITGSTLSKFTTLELADESVYGHTRKIYGGNVESKVLRWCNGELAATLPSFSP